MLGLPPFFAKLTPEEPQYFEVQREGSGIEDASTKVTRFIALGNGVHACFS